MSLFIGPTGQYVNTKGPVGMEGGRLSDYTERMSKKFISELEPILDNLKEQRKEGNDSQDLDDRIRATQLAVKISRDRYNKEKAEGAPKKKRTIIKLGTPYVASEYIAKETARKREKALAGLRKVEDETKARNTKREEMAKRPWYDSYQNAVEVALLLIEEQPELSMNEIEEGSGINQAKKDYAWSSDSIDDNEMYLKVENYIYDNWTKKAEKIFGEREEKEVQEEIKKFKAKYGSQLPTTAAKAIHIPKNMLLVALRVAGFNQKDARNAAIKYNYRGSYGFRIHKTPKRLMISEEKSDFEKKMDVLEKKMEQDLMTALSKKPETMARMIEILKDTPPIKKRK